MDENPLRYFGYVASEPDGTHSFTFDCDAITDDVWTEFNEVCAPVTAFRPFVVDYLALEQDYGAFLKVQAVARAELRRAGSPFKIAGFHSILATVGAQRRLSNFLGATSAFRDRSETRLREDHGKASEDYQAFDTLRQSEHAAHWGYRLMYGLRNYAQHHDSPISFMKVALEDEFHPDTTEYRIALLLFPETLNRSPLISAKLKQELRQHGKPIEVVPAVNECMQSYRRLMLHLIERRAAGLDRFGAYARAMVRKLSLPKGAIPIVWEGPLPQTDGQHHTDYSHMPIDELGLILDIHAKLQKTLPGP